MAEMALQSKQQKSGLNKQIINLLVKPGKERIIRTIYFKCDKTNNLLFAGR